MTVSFGSLAVLRWLTVVGPDELETASLYAVSGSQHHVTPPAKKPASSPAAAA